MAMVWTTSIREREAFAPAATIGARVRGWCQGWRQPNKARKSRDSVLAASRCPSCADRLRPGEPSYLPAVSAERRCIELMGQIGHELRTPLNAIIGFSDIMQRELLGPLGTPRYQDYASHIRESGFSLFKAVEDTLALTRLLAATGSDKRGSLNLDQLLREAAGFAAADSAALNTRIALPDATAVDIRADGDAMLQTVINLLLAAIYSAGENGTVEVACQRTGQSVEITLTSLSALAPDREGASEVASAGSPSQASLALAIGRALVELQHGRVGHGEGPSGSPRLIVTLPDAAT